VKASDKAIVMGVVVAIVLGVFYFKVLSPKRGEASSLKKDITDLQAQVDQQKQTAAFAEDARQHFPTYYGRLVVLGKAVPADADTSSLLVQLNSVASRTGVKFDIIKLNASSSSTSTASASEAASSAASTAESSSSAEPTGTTDTSTGSSGATPPSSTAGATTAATEAMAANLPLGATVGSAGLPVMPYDLTFQGTFFDVAEFLKGVDSLVHLRDSGLVSANGRLLTVDGFSLAPKEGTNPADPTLVVNLAVTSYVTPSDQGLTAGATPGGPAPSVTQPQAQPASATVTP
jgi:Tfp pilus assembly protein PilO